MAEDKDFQIRLRQHIEGGEIDTAINLVQALENRKLRRMYVGEEAYVLGREINRIRDLKAIWDFVRSRNIREAFELLQRLEGHLNRVVPAIERFSQSFDQSLARDFVEQLDDARKIARELERLLGVQNARYVARDLNRTVNRALFLEGVLDENRATFLSFIGVDTLTPYTLTHQIAPFLQATMDLQQLIDSVRGEVQNEIRIRSITQNSPIGVTAEGVGEAITVIRETVVPWRRENARRIAELAENQKRLEIAKAEAEILDLRARTSQARVDTKIREEELEQKKLETERSKIELERMRLELEKQKIENERAKVELAIYVTERIAPNMSNEDRLTFVAQLLRPLSLLVESSLEVT